MIFYLYLWSNDSNTDEATQQILQQLDNDMVRVVGSTFTMGATSEQDASANDNEYPAHEVTLNDFYICKFEVTQELWQAVKGSNPSSFTGNKRPVEGVSWKDCQDFIRKLNKKTGKQYRLPTEAEWEYAARGGNQSRSYKYSGSDSLDWVAWYMGSSEEPTYLVGQKAPNELGLYDMSGNVSEWCQDWLGNYGSGSQTNPTGPSKGSNHVIRGGGWCNDEDDCRTSSRNSGIPQFKYNCLGLRLAMDAD